MDGEHARIKVQISVECLHYVSWLQGVVKALSQAMQFVDIRSKTVRIADSALSWIHRKTQSVQNSNFYLVEPASHVSKVYSGSTFPQWCILSQPKTIEQNWTFRAKGDEVEKAAQRLSVRRQKLCRWCSVIFLLAWLDVWVDALDVLLLQFHGWPCSKSLFESLLKDP